MINLYLSLTAVIARVRNTVKFACYWRISHSTETLLLVLWNRITRLAILTTIRYDRGV